MEASQTSSSKKPLAQQKNIDHKSLPFRDLANIFNLAIEDLERDRERGREICFKAALVRIEQGEWETLNQARKHLRGLEDSSGQSLFTACVEKGMTNRVEEVIKRKMVEDLSAGHYEYALHAAAKRGNTTLLALLWSMTDIDQRDPQGETALHLAIEYGQTAAVGALVKNGASTNLSFKGLSAPAWAISRGALESLDILVTQGKKVALSLQVPEFGNALHIAIQFGQGPTLKHLLTTYIEQTQSLVEQPNTKGRTPLMEAAYLGDLEAIVLLKDKGAPLEQRDAKDQTALHWAVKGESQQAIQVLIYLGAKITAADTEGRKPLDLVRGKDDFLSKTLFSYLINLEKQELKTELKPPCFSIRPPENLVFKGGGPKGIAYVGVLQILEEKGLTRELRRVCGTSAGAITATAIAMNYNAQETLTILEETPLTTFLDHPFTKENLQEAVKKSFTFGKILEVLRDPASLINPIQWIKGLWKTTGVCKGEVFREWMENLVYQKTKIPHCTFGELEALIQKGKPFKELHAFSLKVGENPEICHFHAGDPRWRDLIISDAVRASMSIPGAFVPHTLHFKDAQKKRYPRPDLGSYMDGGVLNNLPIETFDQQGYIYSGLSKEEGAFPTFNRRTLGFSLYSASEKKPSPDKQLNSIMDTLLSLVRLYTQAEQLIRQRTPYNQHRIIEIDNKGVGLLEFNLKPEDQRKLINSGRSAVTDFFSEETGAIGGFILPSLETKERFVSLPAPLANLVPREKHLTYLRNTLIPTDWQPHTPVKQCVLYGLGGVGKTELACHFANQELSHYSLVFWLDSENPERLRSSYHKLAGAVGCYIEKGDTLDTLRNHVHTRLEQQTKPWLLIYDNVEEDLPLPQRGGSILITTQHGDLWQENHHIGPFSIEEGLLLIQAACPTSQPKDREELVNKLDLFPLSLGQAAAYLREEGTSIPEYQTKLREGLVEEGTERHPASLVKTWGVTLKKLREHHPTALAWLECCAYLDAEKIPEFLLEGWLTARPEASGNNSLPVNLSRDILRKLKRYNLISWNASEEAFSLHRQMQSLLKAGSSDRVELDLQAAMEALQGCYIEDNPSTEQLKDNFELLPHFEAVLHHSSALQAPQFSFQKSLAKILYLTGKLHHTLGSYQKAITHSEKALKLASEIWGSESVEIGSYLNRLGQTWYSLGKYEEAKKLHERALDIRGKKLGKEHPDVAICLTSLGNVWDNLGEYEEAIELYERALDILEKKLGKEHPDVATCLTNLGNAWDNLGKYEEAKELYERALDILEKKLGKEHPDVAICLTSLGNVWRSLGQYETAKELYQRALDIWEKKLGKEHPDVAICLNNLGNVWRSLGQYETAKELYERALDILEKKLGKEHPDVAICLTSLGSAWRSLGQYEKAKKLHERALDILEKKLGKEHPDVAICLTSLGNVWRSLGKYEKAKELHKRALDIWEKKLGKEHPDVANSLNNLGNAWSSLGKYEKAIELYQRALNIWEKKLGKEHPDTIRTRENLERAKNSGGCSIL